MKNTTTKMTSRIMTAILSAIMCLTIIPSTAFAEDSSNNDISIEMNMDYSREIVLENYERLMAMETVESGIINSEDGIMPCDANPPSYYHNLDSSDYYYDGSVKGRLYTLKYFDTTSDGKIYLEGFAVSQNINNTQNMWQDVVIEIYDYSTNQCVGSFDIDYRNELYRHTDQSLFYYNFCIYNLDPNKLYYFGFVNEISPSGLEVNGYISHDWTFYYTDAFDTIYG